MKLEQSLAIVEGHLATLDDQKFSSIDFEWHGIQFHAESQSTRSGGYEIRLSAELGRLHFTAENSDYRKRAIDSIYASNRNSDGAYKIGRKSDVHYHSATKTTELLTGQKLLEAITAILLHSSDHLQTIKGYLKAEKRNRLAA